MLLSGCPKRKRGGEIKTNSYYNTIIYAPQPLHKEIRSLAVRFHIPVPLSQLTGQHMKAVHGLPCVSGWLLVPPLNAHTHLEGHMQA